MASVHRGLDRRLERAVAVKILHPHIAERADARERLAREARAIAQLRHENVIEVYDFDIDNPHLTWLVSELVEGTTLRRFIERSGPVLSEIALLVVVDLARALRAAHARGIIHRDIKPDNVLLGPEGRPKLSDFGIAKVLSEAGMTTTGHLVGSPSYMSPEQADGQKVDHRTDIFSLGVVLYRLVTGNLPFKGGTPLETIRRVAVTEYPDPMEACPKASPAVARIIRRCLERDPDARYSSMDLMLEDLQRVAADAELGAAADVLPLYFADPGGVEARLRPRIAEALRRRGRLFLDGGDEPRALECLARAQTLAEGDLPTTELVAQLRLRESRSRRRIPAAVLALAGALAIALGGWWVFRRAAVIVAPVASVDAGDAPLAARPEYDAGALAARPEPDAGVTPVAPEPEPEPEPETLARTARSPKRRRRPPPPVVEARPEPEPEPAPAPPSTGTLHVGTPVWADVYVDGELRGRAPNQSRYALSPGPHQVEARKPDCTPFRTEVVIHAEQTKRLRLKLDCL